jgi:hypothetical protein
VAGFWELCLPTSDARMRPCYVLYCGGNGFSLWLPSLRWVVVTRFSVYTRVCVRNMEGADARKA